MAVNYGNFIPTTTNCGMLKAIYLDYTFMSQRITEPRVASRYAMRSITVRVVLCITFRVVFCADKTQGEMA